MNFQEYTDRKKKKKLAFPEGRALFLSERGIEERFPKIFSKRTYGHLCGQSYPGGKNCPWLLRMIAYTVQAGNEKCSSAIMLSREGGAGQSQAWPLETPDESWQRTMDCHKFTQLISPTAGVGSELVSLLEQI